MPEWMTDLTVGEISIAIVGIGIIFGGGYRLWKLFKPLEEFLTAWNGTPEKKDGAGIVIKDKVPGVIAQIEVLRDQLQNSHQSAAIPNLRDDLDTKASKADVAALAEVLQKHMNSTEHMMPMLAEMHEKYIGTHPPATPPGGSPI